MKNKLLGRRVFNPRLDLDSRRLWPKGIPELQAEFDFSIHSVMWPGHLNLDESLESVLDSLNLDNVESCLVEYLLDSFDWDATNSMSVFKGQGRHISNDFINLNVFLEDGVVFKAQNKKYFRKKCYGGFKYNDLFFEGKVSKEGSEEESSQGICFKGLEFFSSYKDFINLGKSLDSFSDSGLSSLIKKELKK